MLVKNIGWVPLLLSHNFASENRAYTLTKICGIGVVEHGDLDKRISDHVQQLSEVSLTRNSFAEIEHLGYFCVA